MANTASAKKAVRSQARKTDVNRNRRTMVKTNLRRVEDAIAVSYTHLTLPTIYSV